MDKILFEEKTDFQKVQVYHTKSYGNMLVLDDLQSKWQCSVVLRQTEAEVGNIFPI